MSAFRQPTPQPDPWYDRVADWLFEKWGFVLIVVFVLVVAFWTFVGYVAWHFIGRYW